MTDRQFIEVRGARENNLKDISLNIPKQKVTVFTGVSGSGKSSLVFDTIAAEAQRQLNETFTAFVQGFLPHYGQPDVDRIEHLNAPIIIDQKRVGGARARPWAPTPILPSCCGCSSHGLENPMQARPTPSRSTPPRACARSAKESARPFNSIWRSSLIAASP